MVGRGGVDVRGEGGWDITAPIPLDTKFGSFSPGSHRMLWGGGEGLSVAGKRAVLGRGGGARLIVAGVSGGCCLTDGLRGGVTLIAMEISRNELTSGWVDLTH